MKKIILIITSLILSLFITSCDFILNIFNDHQHEFTHKIISGEFLCEDANCTHGAIYYYSCSCGEKGANTFEYSTALGHSYGEYVYNNDATTTENGTKTRSCVRCGVTDTIEAEGTKLPEHVHSYTCQVRTTDYLKSAATCTSAAIYYKSCSCGACGTTTFTYGSKLSHTYNQKVTTSSYLKSGNTYYYSCVCGARGTSTFTKTNSGTVNIFSINDTHGAAFTDEDANLTGLDKVSTLIKRLENTTSYIKVANGDLFQGEYVSNMSQGKVFIDILNLMEFDCFVIGNHEFDWGLDTIAKYKNGDASDGELNCKFLGCNIVNKTTNQKPCWIDDYVIVENNGLKVGIIGAIGENLTNSIAASSLGNYKFVDPVPLIEELAKELRTEEDCDCVIVSIHEYYQSTLEELAALSGDSLIDGVLCAHTHESIQETITRSDNYSMPVLQSYTKNKNVGTLSITISNGKATSSSFKHYTVYDEVSDQNILDIQDNYADIIAASKQSIGYTSSKLTKEDMGDIAIETMCELTGAQYGFINTGGVRDVIAAGDITLADVKKVFPFENCVYYMEITGSKLKTIMTKLSSSCYSNCPSSTSISNTKTYKVAMIDYVFNNNLNTSVTSSISYTNTQNMIYDCVLDYIMENYSK